MANIKRPTTMALLGIMTALFACIIVVWLSPHPSNDAQHSVLLERVELRFDEASNVPVAGWHSNALPFHDFYAAPATARKHGTVLWARFQFDTAKMPQGRIALFTDYTPERFIVLLNGKEIYRNYSDPDARRFASFEPAFVPIPREAMQDGQNELALRLESDVPWTLGLGTVALGDDRVIRNKYDRAYILQYLGPQIINGIMAALTLAILLFWFKRRKEKSFFWLAMVGIVWWLRNLHYSAHDPVIGATALWELVSISLFVLTIAFMCFTVTVLGVRRRRLWISLAISGGITLVLIRWALLATGYSDFLAFALFAPFTFSLSIIFVIATIQHPTVENMVMLVAITIAILWSFHDLIFLANLWQGVGFQLQPFASVVVYGAFAFSLGRRMLSAFDTTENLNTQLEASVAQARHELSESEAARRKLEIAHAVELERERLMREIHDGIGSNLVTALAVAKKQDAQGWTVGVLKRSIADLKIAIDSLEPSDGDVAVVLAGFRQRIEADLLAAGILLKWRVDAVPPVRWLDAPNTLHILRIFQEIVTNIIKHANATEIEVRCYAHHTNGADGVLVEFLDNGIGLDDTPSDSGKGLLNMAARAAALKAQLTVKLRESGRGANASLWLPFAH